MMRSILAVMGALAVVAPVPLAARDDLGVFGSWGSFRDGEVPRCYAIALAEATTRRLDFVPYASISTWPRRGVRGQIYFRLSRPLAAQARISLVIGAERFALVGSGNNAWATGPAMDAAIAAAMRAAARMTVSASDRSGSRFTDAYALSGAATAMDAASVGCAGLRD